MFISADCLILTTLVMTALVAVPLAVLLKPRWDCWLGPPKWDFTTSWASSFTVVGALLGTVLLNSGAVPADTEHMPVAAYAGLNLFFGVMMVLAPLFYVALQKAPSNPENTFRGSVRAFLFSSSLMLWAVLGELSTLLLLLDDIRREDGLSKFGFWLLVGALVIFLPVLVGYWFKTAGWLVTTCAVCLPAKEPGRRQLSTDDVETLKTELRPWPLL